MEYTFETLLEIKNYKEICNIFLELAKDKTTKSILKEILYNGTCQGFKFNTHLSNIDDPFEECQRRISMAITLVNNPDTFSYFINNQINLFHGTNNNAIPSILKYGLISMASYQEKTGTAPLTGEKSTQRENNPRDFVSMTDILDIASRYSEINPDAYSFSVVLCTNKESAEKSRITTIRSDVPEVGLKNDLALEDIKAICCPSNKVSFMKKLVGNKNIMVLPLDNMDKSFYYADKDCYEITIDNKRLLEFREGISKENKSFKEEEVKHLLNEQTTSKIREGIEKIKYLLSRGKSYEHRSR